MPLCGGVRGARVVAGGDRDDVRRRRLGQVPRGRGQPVVLGLVGHHAVRDPDPGRRDGDADVVERLVGGLVVDGVPRERAVRLLHRPRLAARRDRPAAGAEVAAVGRRRRGLRGAGVADLEHVALVLRDRRGDHEVLARVLERHVGAVESHRRDVERLAEVELEVVAGAGRAELDGRLADQRAGVRRPGQVEVVVQGVDARVADVGVDRVLDRLAQGRVERRVVGVGRCVGLAGQGRGDGRRLRRALAVGDWPSAGSRPSSRRGSR